MSNQKNTKKIMTDAIANSIDPLNHLPLTFTRSEIVPPAPNRSTNDSIDWLPEFAGYSWVAYGASSVLVISHLPSPVSPNEAQIGPILRQVIELSGEDSSPVNGVSWSPATPSAGELAAACRNRVFILSYDSSSKGSFCWSQNAVLIHSSTVLAIKWTGSGDGIIAGGVDVVLWKMKNKSWEIAWKFKRDQPQDLISTTWSIQGPMAAAAKSSSMHENPSGSNSNKSVSVCCNDGKPEYSTTELAHPQPVSMIQWRPSMQRQSEKDSKISARHVLLTCCLDGSVRLWTEIDCGKARKPSKDSANKITQHTFCVAAVIEINNALNATLGTDIFLIWATKIGGIFKTTDGSNQLFPSNSYGHDTVGKCEWLVGFGPQMLVTFWAIHCLDDISPMRFPRVKLWKRQDLQDLNMVCFDRNRISDFKCQLLLNKVVISRSYLSGPPSICSLIHLLPCDSLNWLQLYAQEQNDTEDISLSGSRSGTFAIREEGGLLKLRGHTGKIMQVLMHPNIGEIPLAVSLDSNGLVLFWSSSTISEANTSQATLVSRWKICGTFVTQGTCFPYTSIRWAPSVSAEDQVLLMGHVGGIDCFIVRISRTEEEVLCHYICTIPFSGHGPYEDGPTSIFTIPLPSACRKIFKYNKFMLLSVWAGGFWALSWELTLHSYDLEANCCECLHIRNNNYGECCSSKFENTFGSKRYCLDVVPRSSQFPEPHVCDKVTSFSVLAPGNLTSFQTKSDFVTDLITDEPAYAMATGYFDGSLKLWRSNCALSSTLHIPWQLVGKFTAHHGPVTAICLTECGRKIATVCTEGSSNSSSSLCIWDSVHLILAGSFRLEDTLSVGKDVVSLTWLCLGDGQLFIGVCSQKKLQLYAQRNSINHTSLNPRKSLEVDNWSCIAVAHTVPVIHDFVWGPRTTGIVVHDNYFSILSDWLFVEDDKTHATAPVKEFFSAVYTDFNLDAFQQPLVEDLNADYNSRLLKSSTPNTNYKNYSLVIPEHELKLGTRTMLGLWSVLEIAEKLKRPLPIYHPSALFINISSGNWKRAYVSVRHLVECLVSNCASESSYDYANSNHRVQHIVLSNYYEGHLSKTSFGSVIQRRKDSTSTTSSQEIYQGFTPFAHGSDSDGSTGMLGSYSMKSELGDFVQQIEKTYKSEASTNKEKIQLLAIIDLLSEINSSNTASAYENLDEPGRRFWATLKFQHLHLSRTVGRLASIEELVVDSAQIGWAFHSDSQQTLFEYFLSNDPSWEQMRALGVGYWFTNVTQLRAKMEKLARLQYLKRKDPKDCALLYIALNRLQVLAGLFKISKNEKDKPLVGFLTRNFQEEKNKEAALKNAYVLMGRHQFQLAIAFFLLAGDTYSAISVCAKNLMDEQLALVTCRLIEGHGGASEHQLLTKILLPSAIERGDYWLASLLEWLLGNYFKSYLRMLGFEEGTIIDICAISANHAAFVDPNIGLYCLTLATKNSMKNSIGEQNAAIISRWANLMIAYAMNRLGLPLEALDFLSTSPTSLGYTDQRGVSETEAYQNMPGIIKFSASDSFNWLSCDVALHLEAQLKLDSGVQYLSGLIREHPSFPVVDVEPARSRTYSSECDIYQHEKLLDIFWHKLFTGLVLFEQKFSLPTSSLIRRILAWLCNTGLTVIGYDLLVKYISHEQSQEKSHEGHSFFYPLLQLPFLKAAEDISLFLSRFLIACGISSSRLKLYDIQEEIQSEARNAWLDTSTFCGRGVRLSVWSLKAALILFSGFLTKDIIAKPLFILDLFEYYILAAAAWLHRDPKGLVLILEPLLNTFSDGHTPYEVDFASLRPLLSQIPELLGRDLSIDDIRKSLKIIDGMPGNQCGNAVHSFSEDEKWHIIGVCLWQHMHKLLNHKLDSMSIKFEGSFFNGAPRGKFSSWGYGLLNFEHDSNGVGEETKFCSFILAKLLKTTLELISSYHVKELALFQQQKADSGLHVSFSLWLEGSNPKVCHQETSRSTPSVDTGNNDDDFVFDILWNVCGDPNMISDSFKQEKMTALHFLNHKSSKSWPNIHKSITEENGSERICDPDFKTVGTPPSSEVETPPKGLFRNGRSFLGSWQKDTASSSGSVYFETSKEVCKRNGELVEAICINSIDERKAALASNKKGIVFFNLEDGLPFRNQSDYIWSDADWPHNGWAGRESTPVPTFVSPGIGLGSKKGAHLGLGGATTGFSSLSRPGKSLIGNEEVEIPGFAGVHASGLGWQIQDDFEEFLDPQATVENISSRTLSSHPSMPFFLAGSVNTHIYLWEFGKDRATATYGVLPAANVPPPYALASISALQFDHCGHRFATAAVDGTVCTWQLEVGGRSNIHPTESSLCFNSHALDVTYVTSSGSVIAAAGYSSSGANVVIWDTLAPPSTSRASIVCHEGGARSISVFDNDIGSGSVSPLIVTGGKGGDVGLHDFRYIVTGKSRRNHKFDSGEPSGNFPVNAEVAHKSGEQNQNGMLWYIPKAHLGSVTKVSTIPNTSLFLTGSKDGDVKLWDAKAAKLVYHWPRMHERHTFFQPSSHGYGGVVRAAVTDIQVISNGFLTCGGDGSVKLVHLKDYRTEHERA